MMIYYQAFREDNFEFLKLIDIAATAEKGPEESGSPLAKFIDTKAVPADLREKMLLSRLPVNPDKVIGKLLGEVPNPVPWLEVKNLVEKGENIGALAPGTYVLISEKEALKDGPINLSLLKELNFFRHEKGHLPRDTTELMAWALGVNEQSMRTSWIDKSPSFKKDFYGVFAELKKDLGARAFADFSLPELGNTATRNQFLSVLEQLKSHYQIELLKAFPNRSTSQVEAPERQKIWQQVAKEWTLNGHSSDADVSALAKKFAAKTQSYFGEILATNDSTLKTEDLDRLKSEWGDLSPVLVLMARFGAAGRNDLQKELARVFESSLKGTFADYKFHGKGFSENDVTKAAAQMAPLKTPKQIEEWKKDRSLLKLVQPEGDSIQKAIDIERSSFKDHIKTNLVPNLRHAGVSLETPDADTRRAVIDIFSKGADPLDLLKMAREKTGGDAAVADKKILESIIYEFNEGYDPERSSKYARQLVALLSKADSDFSFRSNDQLKNDLKFIAELPNGRKKMDHKESIIVTASTIDPKLLLLTGDLVDAASCQNYRTGSVVETLLGYVTDNTRLILSQNLSPGDFEKGKFAELKQAIDRNSPIDVKINPRDFSLEINFNGANGAPVSLISQGKKFYRRHVLKLGQAETGGPGLFMERGYTQTHPVQDAMAAEALRLMKETAKAVGAKTGEAVTIPASRNPGGQYSDAAGGKQSGEYTIPADPGQK